MTPQKSIASAMVEPEIRFSIGRLKYPSFQYKSGMILIPRLRNGLRFAPEVGVPEFCSDSFSHEMLHHVLEVIGEVSASWKLDNLRLPHYERDPTGLFDMDSAIAFLQAESAMAEGESKLTLPVKIDIDKFLARARAVTDTYTRLNNGPWTTKEQMLKIYEEVGELHSEIKGRHFSDPMLFEICDIIFSSLTIAQLLGFDDEYIKWGIETKLRVIEERARKAATTPTERTPKAEAGNA